MIIYKESEFKMGFEKNYKRFGYSKILRKDIGIFPDFIMLKNDKQVRVELETRVSNFIIHGHSIKDVDDVLCIEKDINLNTNVIQVDDLTFVPKERITITIDKELLKWLDLNIEERIFANRSHGFEFLIKKSMKEDKNGQNK